MNAEALTTATLTLSEEQAVAFDSIMRVFDQSGRLYLLTGRPGTGKTTMLRSVLDEFERRGYETRLAAPTGKASQRLTEKTGRSAQTIHRLLGWTPHQGWTYNEAKPLPCDIVAVDEASMIDLFLLDALVRSIGPRTRLLLVGDPYQLPPVGAGHPLRDLSRSGVVPCMELTQIHRQAADNRIIQAAHSVLRGESLSWDGKRQDFRMYQCAEGELVERLMELTLNDNGSGNGGGNGGGVLPQILCPQRVKSDVASDRLNQLLQERCNPLLPGDREYSAGFEQQFRVGDRVIWLRNNYDLGLWNGDTGVVADIVGSPRIALRVNWQGRGENEVAGRDYAEDIPPAGCNQMGLAYALTIHKAQGSDYGTVIIPFSRSNWYMWTRSLLYTGITRARESCVLVGDLTVLKKAIDDVREEQRRSGLQGRLRAEVAA